MPVSAWYTSRADRRRALVAGEIAKLQQSLVPALLLRVQQRLESDLKERNEIDAKEIARLG